MTDIRYYIKTPNGRCRLQAKNDQEALHEFQEDYTRRVSEKGRWANQQKAVRELIKETRETLRVEKATDVEIKNGD